MTRLHLKTYISAKGLLGLHHGRGGPEKESNSMETPLQHRRRVWAMENNNEYKIIKDIE